MQRLSRFTVENGTYHVMTRCNNRNNGDRPIITFDDLQRGECEYFYKL